LALVYRVSLGGGGNEGRERGNGESKKELNVARGLGRPQKRSHLGSKKVIRGGRPTHKERRVAAERGKGDEAKGNQLTG